MEEHGFTIDRLRTGQGGVGGPRSHATSGERHLNTMQKNHKSRPAPEAIVLLLTL
jgi:hypothetical protein